MTRGRASRLSAAVHVLLACGASPAPFGLALANGLRATAPQWFAAR